MSNDQSYFAERANEERRLAMTSVDPNVRRVHLEMAAQYALKAGVSGNSIERDRLTTERRSA
jgi:hypothetical protein